MKNHFRTLTAVITGFCFFVQCLPLYAQGFNLPAPGTKVASTAAFYPAMIKGITIHPDKPLTFDFLIDRGQNPLDEETFKNVSMNLVKYFLASLTVPEQDMWVNLSPYEKDRIIADGFGETLMGRDLLAQDYMLKQLTASLMDPDNELGKKFWERVYQNAQEKFGSTDIPLNTFNKIWIVPKKAQIYVKGQSVFVTHSELEVLLEEDYVALQKNLGVERFGLDGGPEEIVTGIQSDVIREVLIPEITREVNEGEIFANLRQIYNAMILATWYKNNLKQSLLGQVYADKNKTVGIENGDKDANQKIYEQYLQAFKTGASNLIKEEYDPVKQELVTRKYFSGGADLDGTSKVMEKDSKAILDEVNMAGLTVDLNLNRASNRWGKMKVAVDNRAMMAFLKTFFNKFGKDESGRKSQGAELTPVQQQLIAFLSTFARELPFQFIVQGGNKYGELREETRISESGSTSRTIFLLLQDGSRLDWSLIEGKPVVKKTDARGTPSNVMQVLSASLGVLGRKAVEDEDFSWDVFQKIMTDHVWAKEDTEELKLSSAGFNMEDPKLQDAFGDHSGRILPILRRAFNQRSVRFLVAQEFSNDSFIEGVVRNTIKQYLEAGSLYQVLRKRVYPKSQNFIEYEILFSGPLLPTGSNPAMMAVPQQAARLVSLALFMLMFNMAEARSDVSLPLVDGIEMESDTTDTYGGINLNSAPMVMDVQTDGNGVPVMINSQPVADFQIDGIEAVITNVYSIPSLPQYLNSH